MTIRNSRPYRSLASTAGRARKTVGRHLQSTPWLPYLYILPFYLLFLVFLAFPLLYTVYMSLFEYRGPASGTMLEFDLVVFEIGLPRLSDLEFVGLANYRRLLADQLFHQAIENTIVITAIQLPLMVAVALLVAVLLDAAFVRYSEHVRTVIALPASTNFAAYAGIFLVLFAENVGLVNYALGAVGLPTIPWQTSSFWAKVSLALALDWRWLGYNVLIIFAGLQRIDRDLYEAAAVDGASRWQTFRHVTLPQLRPVLVFVVILSTIASLQLFAEPMVITDGGPANGTITVVMYLYEQAFRSLNLGYASAITYALVVVIAVLAALELRLGRRTR